MPEIICLAAAAVNPERRQVLTARRPGERESGDNDVVIARLDRATQYSRGGDEISCRNKRLWNTGSPAFAGDDSGAR
jgi:hypothetical protein